MSMGCDGVGWQGMAGDGKRKGASRDGMTNKTGRETERDVSGNKQDRTALPARRDRSTSQPRRDDERDLDGQQARQDGLRARCDRSTSQDVTDYQRDVTGTPL